MDCQALNIYDVLNNQDLDSIIFVWVGDAENQDFFIARHPDHAAGYY